MRLLYILTIVSYLLPIVSFLLFSLKTTKIELWVFVTYLAVTFTCDLIQPLPFVKDNRQLIISLYIIYEFIVVVFFLYQSLEFKKNKQALFLCSALVVCYLLYRLINLDKSKFDSTSTSLNSIVIIIFCILYFIEQITNKDDRLIYLSPNFWIIISFLIFMSGTLFLFVVANTLTSKEIQKYWVINNVCNLVTNLLCSIAFIIGRSDSSKTIQGNQYNYINSP